jgi:UDP-2-acetamido-2-deoxy-ribo-hexuluronate aminotransferase
VNRQELKDFLAAREIPAMIYYPVPLHQQKAYTDERYTKNSFPVTEELCKNVISLPMHTELEEDQLKYITDAVLEYISK